MKAIWMTLAIAFSLSAVACGGGCKSKCDKDSQCDGVEDFDTDACEKVCEDGKDAAADADCKSEYGDLVDCSGDNACDDVLDKCESELTKLGECLGS